MAYKNNAKFKPLDLSFEPTRTRKYDPVNDIKRIRDALGQSEGSEAIGVADGIILESHDNIRALIVSILVKEAQFKTQVFNSGEDPDIDPNAAFKSYRSRLEPIFTGLSSPFEFQVIWHLLNGLADSGMAMNRMNVESAIKLVGVPSPFDVMLESSVNSNAVKQTILSCTSLISHSMMDSHIEDLLDIMKLMLARDNALSFVKRYDENELFSMGQFLDDLASTYSEITRLVVPQRSKSGVEMKDLYSRRLIKRGLAHIGKEEESFYKMYLGAVDGMLGGGIYRGQIGFFYARTGVGKTTILTEIFNRIIQNNRKVGVAMITTEINSYNVIDNMIASSNGISRQDLMTGAFAEGLTEEEIEEYVGNLVDTPDYIWRDEVVFWSKSYATVEDMIAQMQVMVNNGKRLFIIDHLHAMKAYGKTEIFQITKHVAETLREFAENNNVAIIMAAQESRDGNIRGADTPSNVAQFTINIRQEDPNEIEEIDVFTESVSNVGIVILKITKSRWNNSKQKSHHSKEVVLALNTETLEFRVIA